MEVVELTKLLQTAGLWAMGAFVFVAVAALLSYSR
jgi:hypothetical protein